MNKTIKRVWNLVSGLLIGMAVLLAIALGGVRLIGIDPYFVLSGSMEPTYQTGSVIYVAEIEPAELKVGDVITFHMQGGTVATHRITEITTENGQLAFRTKGDANDMEDGAAVAADKVIGKPIFTIPQLGYLVSYIQTPSGRYASLAAGAALLLFVFLPDLLFIDDKKAKE